MSFDYFVDLILLFWWKWDLPTLPSRTNSLFSLALTGSVRQETADFIRNYFSTFHVLLTPSKTLKGIEKKKVWKFKNKLFCCGVDAEPPLENENKLLANRVFSASEKSRKRLFCVSSLLSNHRFCFCQGRKWRIFVGKVGRFGRDFSNFFHQLCSKPELLQENSWLANTGSK